MSLTEQEQLVYLANVILIAHADSELSAREKSIIEEVRTAIGAKKGILNSAFRAVESGSYSLDQVGGFAEQVSNLADMLYLGVADGELSTREVELLRPFCQKVGITQGQVTTMLRDAVARSDRLKVSVACPKCKGAVENSARFCGSCGSPLAKTEEASEKLGFEIPASGYAVEFCESTGASFPTALEFAKTAPSFSMCVRGKKNWYLAAWPDDAFAEVLNLAGLLSGLRNRRCYHGGNEQIWDELFGCAWCVRSRQTAYRPAEYCFGKDENRLNPWGCKQARMDWTGWAPWLSYGKFIPGRVWEFDKARIRHELETNLYRFRHCPHLRFDFIDAVIKAIPDTVKVEGSMDWEFSRGYEQTPGSLKIVEKNDAFGFTTVREYYADGVRPKGVKALEKILRQALSEVRRQDITPGLLMSP